MGQTTSCFAAKGSEFLRAAKAGDYVNATSQLQHDIGFVTSSNLKGWTGLHYAAHHGDLKLLQDIILVLRSQTAEVMLIDQQRKKDRSNPQPSTPAAFIDAQINRATVRGQTPLMLACKHGHAAAVKLLLSEGASPLKEDKNYRKTCLHYAAKAGHHECLQLLLAESTTVESETGTVPLNTVRVQDAANITQRYVDARAAGGFTALHLATFYGRLEAVQVLIAAGASLMATTYNLGHTGLLPCETGSTPLHLAAIRGQQDVASALLEAHLQAMGTLGREDGSERFRWEGSDRLDPRMVRNLRRETPYRLALAFGHRALVVLLDPSLPILWVLRPDEVDAPPGDRGPPSLASMAAKALREHLVGWLEGLQVELDAAAVPQVEQKDTAAQQDAQDSDDLQITAAPQSPATHPPAPSSPSSSSSSLCPSYDTYPDRFPRPPPPFLPASSGPAASTCPLPTPFPPMSPFANAPELPPPAPLAASMPIPPRRAFRHTHTRSADAAASTWAEATTRLAHLLIPHTREPGSIPSHPHPPHGPHLPRFESLPEDSSLPLPSIDPPTPPSPPPRPVLEPSPSTPAPSTSTPPVLPPLRDRRHSADGPHPPPTDDPPPPSPAAPGSPLFYTSCWFVPWSRNPGAAAARSDSLVSPSTLEALLDPPLTTLRASPFLTSRAAGKDARGTPIVLQSIPRGTRLRINAVRGMVTLVRPVLHLAQRKADPQPSIKGWEGDSASSDGSDRECGICLDTPQQLAIQGCNHRLCLSCTKALCQDSTAPALCPFCRRTIGGFERIPLAPPCHHLACKPFCKDA